MKRPRSQKLHPLPPRARVTPTSVKSMTFCDIDAFADDVVFSRVLRYTLPCRSVGPSVRRSHF